MRAIVEMKADLEMLKTAFGNALKVGPVEVIDADKGYRIKLGEGEGGQPYLSPWYPHPESGGATSTWVPLSKGQIVGILNPAGDQRQGILLRAGFSGENSAPSDDLAANVFAAFGLTATVKGGKLTIDGDLVVNGNVDFAEGHVRHNRTNIGDTHVHGGIVPGPADTGTPH